MLTTLKTWVDRFVEFTTLLVMGVLVLVVLWQVATRFVLKNPSSWTEELATYLLVWVGLLGSAVALNRGAHLGIDYFVGRLAHRQRLWTELAVFISVAGFAVSVLLVGGWQLVSETFQLGQTAPATGLKLGYVYLVVPITGFFITFYSLELAGAVALKLRQPGSNPPTVNDTSEGL